jgi:hypothetical protein
MFYRDATVADYFWGSCLTRNGRLPYRSLHDMQNSSWVSMEMDVAVAPNGRD